jgi:cytidylate kinase
MAPSTEELRRSGIATAQVEYQMRFRDLMARAAHDPKAELAGPPTFGPFLTISRETGSGGAEVALRVGQRLGWAVLDRQLVEHLAHDLELAPQILRVMDETRANWFSETLLNLFNSKLVAQQAYVEMLGKVIALAASSGPVVVVGRGAHLILPPEPGLRARLVAPRAYRVGQVARSEGIDHPEAERRIEEIDGSKRAFIRRNFRSDIADPTVFDLVVNVASFGIDGTVELVIDALDARGLTSVGRKQRTGT